MRIKMPFSTNEIDVAPTRHINTAELNFTLQVFTVLAL